MSDSQERLKAARRRLAKSADEVASAAGISTPSYYDLEMVDGEIESGLSLQALVRLCSELRILPGDLFGSGTTRDKISMEGLVVRIKKHLEEDQIGMSDFEARVGFEIRRCLEDPLSILEWDIECLQSVCKELSVNWMSVLEGMATSEPG